MMKWLPVPSPCRPWGARPDPLPCDPLPSDPPPSDSPPSGPWRPGPGDAIARAEAALRESEEKFRLAFASANTGMCLVSPEGRLLEVNARMADIFGYSQVELERMSVNDIALPDDLSISPGYIQRALEGEDATAVFEKRYRHRDGSIVHGLVSSSLVRDGQGRPRYFISQVQDISERKRQEAQLELQRQQLTETNRALAETRDALAQDRARLAATLNALLDPHVLLGPVRDGEGRIVDFRYLEANAAACAYNQLSREQLLGSSLLALLPAHRTTGLLEQYRAVIETGQALVIDDVVYPHEIHQEERRFDIRAVKVGDVLSYTWRDVTERYRSAQRLVASEEHYRLLAENSGDVVLLLDDGGLIRWVSPSLTAALGWAPEAWIGQPSQERLSPRGEALQSEANRERLRQGQTLRIRQKVPARDGRLHWIDIHANPFRRADGQLDGVVVTFRTIDAEVAAERELRLSEERHRLLADNALDVLWTMAPDGTITDVSAAVEAVRGLTPAEAMVQPLEAIHPPASAAISRGYFSQLFNDLRAGRPLKPFRGELEYFHRDGSTVWMDVIALPLLDDQGQIVELLGVSRDITERKRTALELQRARDAAEAANQALQAANRELELLATTDALTGLWNRRQLDERVRSELDRADRYGDELSLVLFDIDHFKAINDRFGHAAGDRVLVELARWVRGQLRESDGLGRWGGEEFLVLMPHSTGEEARQLAEKLRRLVAETPIEDVGTVTGSFGVAQRRPLESAESWFRRVDGALYRAKQAGRNRVELDPVLGLQEPLQPAPGASTPGPL